MVCKKIKEPVLHTLLFGSGAQMNHPLRDVVAEAVKPRHGGNRREVWPALMLNMLSSHLLLCLSLASRLKMHEHARKLRQERVRDCVRGA